MAKKKTFLKNPKQIKATALSSASRTTTAGVSFLAAKGATNKLINKIPVKYQKLVGPGKFLIGLGISAVVDDNHPAAPFAKGFGDGLAVSGFDSSADAFLPEEIKTNLGLDGVSGLGKTSASDQADWETMAEAAEQEVEKEVAQENAGDPPGPNDVYNIEEELEVEY